jgi:superfamily II DNA or RNA helicase
VGSPVTIVGAGALKALMAKHILGEGSERRTAFGKLDACETRETRLGSITLHPHQISAVRRARAAMDEFGGALLCDEVGMGKTFVALAIAKSFASCAVVAPAVLRDMWSLQSQIAGAPLRFVSFEQLSRGRRPGDPFDLVIVDEAHHARNRATRRYAELSRMMTRARALLLSATPIHNSSRDLSALLALFLGSLSEALTPAEIARCVIRREVNAAGLASRIPSTGALRWLEITDDPRIPEAIMALPPPLPVRDGGLGGVLVARALLRQWCSSDAALESALRRRLGRSLAMIQALESGHYPSENELSAWTIADDSVQLAFPSLVATPMGETSGMLDAIGRHQAGLRALLRSLKREPSRDTERARLLTEVRRAHAGIPIVAFSQYAETVTALFRELRGQAGVAALTAKGARVAGGSLTRPEALARFAPRASGARAPREAERIDVLLTTDLLSEGVNLQDAGVVVHLDLPWTGARLEQRIGRVARLGSERRRVFAYGIRPSQAGEMLIRMESTIARKLAEMRRAIGPARHVLPVDSRDTADSSPAPTNAAERIRVILDTWMDDRSVPESMPAVEYDSIQVAAVASDRDAFLALCAVRGKFVLITSGARGMSDDPAELLETLIHAQGPPVAPDRVRIERSLRSVHAYFRSNRTVGAAAGMTTVALARGAALRRVAVTIERAKPHTRARLVHLGAAARRAILGRMNLAAESDLAQVVSREIPDEEWLLAAAGSDDSSRVDASPSETREGDEPPRIVALFLLQA